MKWIYILIVLVIAAATLGCVGNKKTETSIKETTTEIPAQTTLPPTGTAPAGTPTASDDIFGTETDLGAVDAMYNDLSMDITLSDSI